MLGSGIVNVMVSDLDRSVAFYCESLGLTLKQRYGEHYAEIETEGLKIGLHPSDKPIPKEGNLSIGFGVPKLDEVTKALEQKGLEFKITQDGWSPIAHFYDPDGHPLFIIELKDDY